jgi:hypothetical protein
MINLNDEERDWLQVSVLRLIAASHGFKLTKDDVEILKLSDNPRMKNWQHLTESIMQLIDEL